MLVCAPTASIKEYCEAEYFSRILNLTYPSYSIMIADNSHGKEYSRKLKSRYPSVEVQHIPRGNMSNPEYIAKSHERCRQYAVSRGFDYIMHIETDIIVPFDIIESLLNHGKKICGASYFVKPGENAHLMVQMEEKINAGHGVVYDLGDGALSMVDGGLKKVHSIGLGCLLIHRDVFTKIPFRYEKGMDAYPDSFFAVDAKRKGFNIWWDTSLTVPHRATGVYDF